MKRIDFPTDVFGSIDDYFPAEEIAEADPRADVPPVESAHEFGNQPETPHNSDAIRAVKNPPVAFPLQAFGNIWLDCENRNYLVKEVIARTGLAVAKMRKVLLGSGYWAAYRARLELSGPQSAAGTRCLRCAGRSPRFSGSHRSVPPASRC